MVAVERITSGDLLSRTAHHCLRVVYQNVPCTGTKALEIMEGSLSTSELTGASFDGLLMCDVQFDAHETDAD